MYPGLTWPLLGLLALTFVWMALVALRVPAVRRLAGRQLTRRRAEAGLVIAGSMLGTAIVVGSLIVGDTLRASIERGALASLGPVDEIVTAGSTALAGEAARRLDTLRDDPDIDGLLTVRRGQASVASQARGRRRAEPHASLWEVDFGAAAGFGGGTADGGSGLGGLPPAPGEAVVNTDLAEALDARAGDTLTFYMAGRATPLRVARIVPTAGLAALRDDDGTSRNAFFAPGTLVVASRPLTLVSNAGGAAGGARRTDSAVARLTTALGPLASRVAVDAVKRDALDSARESARDAGSLLLSLGAFAILAGVLLLANVFVMLAEERTAELGTLRAIGLRRGWLVHSLTCEGTVYALVASVAGVAAGIGLGRVIAGTAARWFADGATAIEFHVTPASLVNGFALGLLAGVVTVALVSLRISRLNVVAALHDLPAGGARRPASRRRVTTVASAVVLCWLLTASAVRPRAVGETSAAAVTVLGVLLVLSGVLLLSSNQRLLALPLRPLGGRSPRAAATGRLAVAYPAARPLRTGAIITMYALVMFMLVLITLFGHLVAASSRSELRNAFGGFGIRLDWRPSARLADPRRVLAGGRFAHRVDLVVPLTIAGAELADGTQVAAVGVEPTLLPAAVFRLDRRLGSLGDDRAVWRAVLSAGSGGAGYAIVAPRPGGPSPGTVIGLADPATGRVVRQVTVAGVLRDGSAFRGAGQTRGGPVIMSAATVRSAFGRGVTASSALLRPTPGTDVSTLLADLQGEFLAEGLVGLDARQHVAGEIAANQAFFQLLRGFVALGLAVGVAGLAVVMARAVRDRHRHIGILRALGLPRRMVLASLLAEGMVVALQGILLGTVLSLVTGYQLFRGQPALRRSGIAFTVPWLEVAGLVAAVAAVSLLVSAWPAGRALRLHPASALRVRD